MQSAIHALHFAYLVHLIVGDFNLVNDNAKAFMVTVQDVPAHILVFLRHLCFQFVFDVKKTMRGTSSSPIGQVQEKERLFRIDTSYACQILNGNQQITQQFHTALNQPITVHLSTLIGSPSSLTLYPRRSVHNVHLHQGHGIVSSIPDKIEQEDQTKTSKYKL